jgi:hypothetical protein
VLPHKNQIKKKYETQYQTNPTVKNEINLKKTQKNPSQ